MSEKSITLQQKTRVMSKLFNIGCTDEKKLQALTLESILEIKGIGGTDSPGHQSILYPSIFVLGKGNE